MPSSSASMHSERYLDVAMRLLGAFLREKLSRLGNQEVGRAYYIDLYHSTAQRIDIGWREIMLPIRFTIDCNVER